MEIKGSAQHLADVMIQISKQLYSETWAFGLEFELWNEVFYDQDRLDDQKLTKLKDLSDSCKGWIIMNYRTDKLEFISLDGWKKMYRDKKPF